MPGVLDGLAGGPVPGFAIEGGLPLALTRDLAVAALLSAFGCLVFSAAVLPRAAAGAPDAAASTERLDALARRSLGAALGLLAAWLVVQTADLAGSGIVDGLASVPAVLGGTLFGHVLILQAGAAAGALMAVRHWTGLALALSGTAVLLQAGHGHAWSMESGPGEGSPGLLLIAGLVHLLAAGAWLGGLWPLLIVVRDGSPRAGALAARWFSPMGKACVAGIVLSSAAQSWVLVGSWPGLVGTAYGWVALAKLGLLGVLLAFAAANRYRLAPALLRTSPEAARRRLVRAVAVQTGFGLATVLAAGVLSNLPPAMHEQSGWPFPLRPSLAVMADAELAGEVWTGALLLAGAAALLLAPLWHPLRRAAATAPVVAVAAILAWLAAPHLQLLLVEAYPTSYYTSPSGFAAASIVQGQALYPGHCARCHGAEGRGDGPDAKTLAVPPADLTAAHLWEHADGELFWWLLHGMAAPDGTPVMPGTAGVLSDDQRWALIDAIRARNAGLSLRDAGAWPQPVQLPGFSLACPGQASLTTEELRGRVLYLTIGPVGTRPAGTDRAEVLSVMVTRDGAHAGTATCTATDPAAWDALATVTGQLPDALAGTRLLVDGHGWLRAWKPDSAAWQWDDPTLLSADVSAIQARPAGAAPGGGHHH